MINIQNLGSNESLGIKFKDDIGAELCLKLWFESDCYLKSDWLSRNKVPNSHFLKFVSTSNNCPEAGCKPLTVIFNQMIKYQLPYTQFDQLVIINMTYTCMESY